MIDRARESWIRDAIFDDPRIFLELAAFSIQVPVSAFTHRAREYPTLGGDADLLFFGLTTAIVVEVKRETIDEQAVAQCLRYMGALDHTPEFRDRDVYGFCVAPRISNGAKLTARAAGIFLMEAQPFVKLAWPKPYTEPETQTPPGDAIVEATPLPVLSRALEGRGGSSDVLVGCAGALD